MQKRGKGLFHSNKIVRTQFQCFAKDECPWRNQSKRVPMESTRLDVKFLADERELYDELQTCSDEDALLIVMSDIQAHFQEELKKQQDVIYEKYQQMAKKEKKESSALEQSIFFKNSTTNPSSLMTASITSNSSKFQFHNASTVTTIPNKTSTEEEKSDTTKRKLDLSIPLKREREEDFFYFKKSICTFKKKYLFCDIKFVKNIFVRWLSSPSEVLSHVTSRTLAVLFSHAYLTSDQILDLAELLLGVHESETKYPVRVLDRASRSGVLYSSSRRSSISGSSMSSNDGERSSPSDHHDEDDEATDEEAKEEGDDEDDSEEEASNKKKNGTKLDKHEKHKNKTATTKPKSKSKPLDKHEPGKHTSSEHKKASANKHNDNNKDH
ncbi:hypothetical protein RFI_05554, partial [Reticulomyxa filosa]